MREKERSGKGRHRSLKRGVQHNPALLLDSAVHMNINIFMHRFVLGFACAWADYSVAVVSVPGHVNGLQKRRDRG